MAPRPTGSPIEPTPDEGELLLRFLEFLREAIIRKVEDLDEAQARWQPDGKLIRLIGIVNHLTSVEGRWIDGWYRGEEVSRSEEEFHPDDSVTVASAVAAYRRQGEHTRQVVASAPSMTDPCRHPRALPGLDLRWVVVHLIEETARHAGHADAVREMLDGTTGV